MDKLTRIIFWWSIAVTMAIVMGKTDENPLKTLFDASSVWTPLINRMSRFAPYQSSSDHIDYAEFDQEDIDDGTRMVAKRSHARQAVCDTLLNMVYVGNGTDGFEYRPNHYITETCLGSNQYNSYQNKCTETGLSCTQIRQKIYITRRKNSGSDSKAANCWEHVALKEIDAGCECMWPKELIGDKYSYRLGK
ncbi:uncharacterized protein LOC126577955 [Anopheles aquasalis]|uniref:uncharacterized protein LOC126577955 n=1 Tax=Anopheles aquasalis TaxID=42839 RepID=UPI00215AAE62|nr:uncharacterized protein LOC126577955 [Anopheles aquasalis]